MRRKTRGQTIAQAVHQARRQRHTSTPAEELLWQALRSRQLGLKFRRQHPLGPYILDAYCVEHQLAIEADGGIHNTPAQREHDMARTLYLHEHGIRVLRFTNQTILENIPLVLHEILKAVHPLS